MALILPPLCFLHYYFSFRDIACDVRAELYTPTRGQYMFSRAEVGPDEYITLLYFSKESVVNQC